MNSKAHMTCHKISSLFKAIYQKTEDQYKKFVKEKQMLQKIKTKKK